LNKVRIQFKSIKCKDFSVGQSQYKFLTDLNTVSLRLQRNTFVTSKCIILLARSARYSNLQGLAKVNYAYVCMPN